MTRLDRAPDPAEEVGIAARHIEPGDFLPPQRALHGTRFQDQGFRVGDSDRDVVTGLPVLAGRVLLYGPHGSLDLLPADAQVTVRRQGWRRPG